MIPRQIIRKVRHIQIRTRHSVNEVFAGRYHSAFKGRGMEFHEVREYTPGDDIRAIDWNVTARIGHPFVKKYIEERELTVMLVVDISRSQLMGSKAQTKKDVSTELAAVLAFSAIMNNDRVGLILFSDRIEHFVPPDKGTRHVLRIIRDLLFFRPTGIKTDLTPALDYLNHITRRGTVTFLISDFYFPHPNLPKLLAVTARRHDLIAVLVSDSLDTTWPSIGLVQWYDPEADEYFLTDTTSRAVRAALAATQARRYERIVKDLHRTGVDTIHVTTGSAYEKALITFFHSREIRRGM